MTDYPALIVSLATLIASGGAAAAAVITAMKIGEVKTNVQKIETATNSMKDALVDATRLAGEAKGRDDERARQGDQAPRA